MLSKLRQLATLACVLLAACHDEAPSGLVAVPQTIARPSYFDAALAAVRAPAPRAALPGAVTAVDRAGAPRFVFTHEPAPALADLAITPAARARGATTPAAVAALWHLQRNAARWQLDADALATTYVAHVHDLGHGAIVVQLRQRVAGVEVAHTSLAAILDRDLHLIGLSGGLSAAARPTAALVQRPAGISASAAVARAFDDLGVAPPALAPLPDRAGWRRLAAPSLPIPARAREVLYPLGDALVPAWETEVAARDAGKRISGVRHVFAADDGRLLARGSLTADAAPGFTYRVWADATGDLRPQDGPQGDFTPHPTGIPDGFQPAFVAPSDVFVDGFNHAPGGGHDPWLPPTATTLTGNNVEAYADLDSIDGLSGGDVQATLTGPRAFARTFDVTADPLVSPQQSMAAITEEFYVTNWLHDYWYDSGFTEAAGNAQTSNLGRGGVEGDPLHAEGQDSSGTDNANMTTPGDGGSPQMQMYIFNSPTAPRRDGTIDNQVIEHEWAHYLHHRLVTTCDGTQCGGMSEGWADFDSLLTGARATDNLDGTYGMGGYVSLEFTPDAAYYGIRRYPYSTDLTKSPLTLRYVRSGVPLPSGIPNNASGGDNYEVHDIGEIWCAMLWEGLVVELKESAGTSPRFTFEQARRRFADYVVAGMMASPPEPTFTEARDALLSVIAASDTTDFTLIATAFARRGFGTGAVSPPVGSSDGAGVVESFSVTGAMSVESATLVEHQPSCDNDGFLDAGETADVTVTVRNVGAAALVDPTITLSPQTSGLHVVGAATAHLGAIAPFGTAHATLQVTLDELPVAPSSVTVGIAVDDASAALAHVDSALTAPANLDVIPAASATEDFAAPTLAWTVSSGWSQQSPAQTDTQTASVRIAASGDHALTSPALQVIAGQHLGVTLLQRYQMAAGQDGGVLEISTDGVTFTDVSTVADPGYDGPITGAGNVLAGRNGWTGTSLGYAGFGLKTIDLGTGFGGQTVFLRFRAGGAALADASTWDIDQVAITGISNTPFPVLGPETGSCLPGHRPVANAGAAFTVPSGGTAMLDGSQSSDADGNPLTYAWQQLSGLAITLDSSTAAQPTFTAPTTAVDRVIEFQLVVTDSTGRPSVPATVTFQVIGAGAVDGPPQRDDMIPDGPVMRDAAHPDAGADAGTPLAGGGGCAAGGGPGGAALLVGLALAARRRR